MYVYETNSPHDFLEDYQNVEDQIKLREGWGRADTLIKLLGGLGRLTGLRSPIVWAPYVNPFDEDFHTPIDILIVKFDNNGTTFFISDVFIPEWRKNYINHRTNPIWLDCTKCPR